MKIDNYNMTTEECVYLHGHIKYKIKRTHDVLSFYYKRTTW